MGLSSTSTMATPGPEMDARIEPIDMYSGDRIMQNMMVLSHSRVVLSIMGGIAAGVMGLTALSGLLFMVVWGCMLSMVFILQIKGAGGDILDFVPSAFGLVYDTITGNAMTYIMFWTLSYDCFHLF